MSPNDGKRFGAAAARSGHHSRAADPEKGDTTVAVPSDDALPGDVDTKGELESEAEVILDESKKNFRVTQERAERVHSQWDPQTQMTKEEWAAELPHDARSTSPKGN